MGGGGAAALALAATLALALASAGEECLASAELPAGRSWLQQGHESWRTGRVKEAAGLFRRGAEDVRSAPEVVFESRMALAKVLAYHEPEPAERERDLWEALRQLQAAARARPEDPDVAFHQGVVLEKVGLVPQALEAYARALAFDPQMTFAHANKAMLHLRLREREPALASAVAAVELEPLNGALHNNLAVVLDDVGRGDEATRHWLEAVRLQPDCIEAHASLGNAFQDRSRTALARRHWETAGALAHAAGQETLAAAIQVRSKLGLERAFESLQHVAEIRQRYDEALESLLLTAASGPAPPSAPPGFDALGQMVTDIGYYYAYLGFPNIQARERQARLFRAKVPALADPTPLALVEETEPPQVVCHAAAGDAGPADEVRCQCDVFRPSSNQATSRVWTADLRQLRQGTVRIGFLSEFVADHSVSKLIRNTIRFLAAQGRSERWEVVLFMLSTARRDGEARRLMGQATRVVHVSLEGATMLENVLATRRAVEAEALDILVFPEVGMSHLTYFAAHARMAPVQIAFWGHPVTTGMPDTVDYFVSSRLFERNWSAVRDGRKYSEKLWLMRGLCTLFPPPPPLPTPSKDREAARKRILGEPLCDGRPCHLYVVPQTAYKFHPLMDRALADILAADRQALLVLIDSKHSEWMQTVVRRIDAALLRRAPSASRQGRVQVVPPLAAGDFLALLGSVADVVLDTFPFGGGVSHLEALSVGAPVVVLAHTIPWIPQFARGIYDHIFASPAAQAGPPLVAHSVDEYVRTAVAIATDPRLRAAQSARIRAAAARAGLFHEEGRTDNVRDLLSDWSQLFACAQTAPPIP